MEGIANAILLNTSVYNLVAADFDPFPTNLVLTQLEIKPLETDFLTEIVALDGAIFKGLWNAAGYQEEIERSSSVLLGVTAYGDPANAFTLEMDRLSVLQTLTEAAPLHLLGMGCLWTILDEAHITLLGVHPDYRNQGLGQALLCGLLQAAHQRQLARATLEVRASNQAALSLYEKFGFKVAGRRKGYYADPCEDGLLLWCRGLQMPTFAQQLNQWRSQAKTRIVSVGWTDLQFVL